VRSQLRDFNHLRHGQRSSESIRTPAAAPVPSWGTGQPMPPSARRGGSRRPRDHHCSHTRTGALIASHTAIHVNPPKALTSAPAARVARESDRVYLQQLLGEVSASVEPLQVANEVRAGHSLPNVLGEPGGEKRGGVTCGPGCRRWLEQVPQTLPSPWWGEGPAGSQGGCLKAWGSCQLRLDSGSLKSPPFSKPGAPRSHGSQFGRLIPTLSPRPLPSSALILCPPAHHVPSTAPLAPPPAPSLAQPCSPLIPGTPGCPGSRTRGSGRWGQTARGRMGPAAAGTYVSVQICVEQHQGAGEGVGSVCSTSTGQELELLAAAPQILGQGRGAPSPQDSPQPTPPTQAHSSQCGAGSTRARA